MGLEFGKGLFDRVEVGRVGRQEAELSANRLDQLTHLGVLVRLQIVMITMSPGDRVGTRHWRTYSTKIALVIAWSMTKGAVTASCRRAATKVVIFCINSDSV
jgi:hypothetical protein